MASRGFIKCELSGMLRTGGGFLESVSSKPLPVHVAEIMPREGLTLPLNYLDC